MTSDQPDYLQNVIIVSLIIAGIAAIAFIVGTCIIAGDVKYLIHLKETNGIIVVNNAVISLDDIAECNFREQTGAISITLKNNKHIISTCYTITTDKE